MIQRESIFSENETLEDIQTECLKLLMVPYYEAQVNFRLMDDREERVRIAHTYFLEYLKLMNHYGLLEKPHQEKAWKSMYKTHIARQKGKEDDEVDQGKPGQMHPMMAL